MEENNGKEVPFDMSKETLKSIRKWIDKISELSIGVMSGQSINPNDLIVIKHKMVGQLIVLASPLLGENKEEIETYYSKIKINKGDIRNGNNWNRNVSVYSSDVDSLLNECVKGIQEALRKYFIPSFSEGEKYYG